jgi:hypothetical protein
MRQKCNPQTIKRIRQMTEALHIRATGVSFARRKVFESTRIAATRLEDCDNCVQRSGGGGTEIEDGRTRTLSTLDSCGGTVRVARHTLAVGFSIRLDWFHLTTLSVG